MVKTHRVTPLVVTLLIFLAAIVALDQLTGTDAVGASAQVALRFLKYVGVWCVQSFHVIAAAVFRRRVWRFVMLLTPVGFGYFGNIIFSETRMRRAEHLLRRYRSALQAGKEWWHDRSTLEKFLIVFIVIALQAALLPAIAQYIVFFPYRFMIPVVKGAARWFYSRTSDTFVGVLYWKYCGATHWRVMRAVREYWLVKYVHDGLCLLRLQYLTAWRLWKYDEKYRNEAGELWVSFIEPIRLWRRGTLNRYVGRPLFASKYKACYFWRQATPAA